MSRITIRFVSGWRAYNAGERAGFERDLAGSLVSRGVALYVDDVDQLEAAAKSESNAREKETSPEHDLTRLSWPKLKSVASAVGKEHDEDFVEVAGGQAAPELIAYIRSRLSDDEIQNLVSDLAEGGE